jgi:2-polyprenyl-3-methyl-5-hydroxy-6-metoxy-1,4-benzoquinol methylase
VIDHCPQCNMTAAWYARATDIEYFTTKQEFDFYHCADCDIVFIYPMLRDQLSTIYPPNYYAFDDKSKDSLTWKVKGWLDRILLRRVLSRIPGEGLSVIDVGGGTGWMSTAARQADGRVQNTLVVDLDSQAETRAHSQGHDFFCGRIEDLDSSQSFDLVLMLNLIEHVPNPDQILKQVSKLLSPRGRILIQTPNFRSLDASIFRYRSWGGYHCPRHFILFSQFSMNRILERNSLVVESFQYTQGATFWATSLMHAMAQIGLISAGPHRPYHTHPIAPLVQIVAAGFDFLRRPFSKTSQMMVVAKHGNVGAHSKSSAPETP